MLVRTTLSVVFLAAAAGAVPLELPIDCTPGETCHIQQYTDRDPGPGATDFTCGGLSYDGHKGTDFALATDADIARDVAVLAAAPGTVTAVRDTMPDHRQGTDGAPDVSGRECGNGVVIDHGAGWETQYCHLRQGSISVAAGQNVNAGTPLGAVGLSGKTEFPHLHISVRHDGAVIDPFDPGETASCDTGATPLWTDPLTYAPGALLALGWAGGVPDYEAVKSGTAGADTLSTSDAALVLWALAYGGQPGDVLRLRWSGPGGETFEAAAEVDRAQARFFRAGGRRTPSGGWPTGTYAGSVEMVRDGTVIDRAETEITLD